MGASPDSPCAAVQRGPSNGRTRDQSGETTGCDSRGAMTSTTVLGVAQRTSVSVFAVFTVYPGLPAMSRTHQASLAFIE